MSASQDAAADESARPLLGLQVRPELPTHCYFLGNARRADVLWTRDDYRTLCHRMLNGNGEHEFLLCYRDAQEKTKFSKAYCAKASARIDWAFDTICGTAKRKTGIGFYPCNGDDESCWGALDFDAHNPEERIGRAYIFAGKAFDLLCREAPNLWLIAGTSGESGGWHVFVFAPFFYSTGEWARFLREVADRIGVPIQRDVVRRNRRIQDGSAGRTNSTVFGPRGSRQAPEQSPSVEIYEAELSVLAA